MLVAASGFIKWVFFIATDDIQLKAGQTASRRLSDQTGSRRLSDQTSSQRLSDQTVVCEQHTKTKLMFSVGVGNGVL